MASDDAAVCTVQFAAAMYVYDRHLPNYVWSGPLLRHAGINGSSVEGTVTHPRDSSSAKLGDH